MTFQYYEQIFVASYITREIIADRQAYTYQRIKDTILTNSAGIEVRGSYSIASPERAFLDVLYRSKSYHVDNLRPLNWDEIFRLLPVYASKRMEQKVQQMSERFHATN